MIDHISFCVKNFDESLVFYDQTLRHLGYERLMTFDQEDGKMAGYGSHGKPSFWIGVRSSPDKNGEEIGRAQGLHVAFSAPDIESIQRWYEACLSLGGRDNGAPGPRGEYHPGYYGAFIIDPNGWRIEACLHYYDEA